MKAQIYPFLHTTACDIFEECYYICCQLSILQASYTKFLQCSHLGGDQSLPEPLESCCQPLRQLLSYIMLGIGGQNYEFLVQKQARS